MRKWWPLVAVSLGAFMLLVDITIVVVALPAMSAELDASFSAMQWVMDAYALALAALLLGTGSLADRFGRRRTYVAGLVLFGLASLACGLAPGAGVLVAARAVQGVGGAAVFATAMALLDLSYQGRERGIAYGVWGAVTGAAAAAGPVLGGLLAEHVSWRAIFLVNPPVVAVTVVLALAVLKESRDPGAHRFDLPGVVTFTVAAGSLTYALIQAGEHGWGSAGALGWAATGVLALAAFWRAERRAGQPMLDLKLFRRPAFVGVMLAAVLVSVAAFAYTVYTSLWLQTGLGLGAVETGLALLPMSGAAFLTSLITARPLAAAAPRKVIPIGLALIGAGALAQAVLDAGSTWAAIAPGLAISGVGVGLGLPALSSAAMASVPPGHAGMASGALNTGRQLGMALGIAALGAAFAGRVQAGLPGRSAAGLIADGRPGQVLAQSPELAEQIRAALAAGLNTTLVIAAAAGLAGALLVAVLLRGPAPAPRPEVPVRS